MAPKLETPKSSDPLASLRIDRTQAEGSRPRWGSRLAFVLLFGVAIGAGVYVWFVHAGDLLRPELKTAVAEVRVPGVSDSVLAAQGYIKSRRQAAIGAKVAGRIQKINVEEGQRVEEGEVLAELEHADTDASLEAMRA